jgi:hypothetical protein
MRGQHYETDEAVQQTVRTWLRLVAQRYIPARAVLVEMSGSFWGVRGTVRASPSLHVPSL